MPGVAAEQGVGKGRVVNNIEVGFGAGRFASVKRGSHLFNPPNYDIGGQETIKGCLNPLKGEFSGIRPGSHLTPCVNPGIGTTGTL